MGPKKLTKKDLVEAGYTCTSYLQKLSKKDSDKAFYLWNEVMQKTTKLFFELHNIWLPKFSNVESAIKKEDGNFFKLYDKACRANINTRASDTKKMLVYLINKFKLPQTGEIYFLKDEN